MFRLEFTDPSAGELQERRRQLNGAGFQAYCLPIIGILFMYALRNALSSHHVSDRSTKTVQNPSSSSMQRQYRRFHWLLTTTCSSEYGPVYLQIMALGYFAVLMYIVVAPTVFGDRHIDYMHLTKAFGHVGVSQLPLLYLLSVKSPSSPVAIATGFTHERLNTVHRLLGRVILTLLSCHVAFYLNFFVVKGLLVKALSRTDVRTGLLGFSLLSLLAGLAQPFVRQRWYHAAFYRAHVLVSVMLLGIIWVHVPYTRIYIAQAGGIWIFSAVSRRGHSGSGWSASTVVTCDDLGNGSNLIEVTASIKGSADKTRWQDHWVPGMHTYLNQGILGPKTPLTVVSVEHVKNGQDVTLDVKMIARNLRGPATGLLAEAAKGEKSLTCSLEGPYGEAKEYIPGLLRAGKSAGKVLIVAGGVGATYAMPIYIALLEARQGDCTGLKLIWIVKNGSDAHWGVEQLRELDQRVDVEIITTQSSKETHTGVFEKSWRDIQGLNYSQGAGRSDLYVAVNRFITAKDQRACVMVCGPSGLARGLRSEIGKQITSHGTYIDWYEEQFGFGG